MDCEAAGDKCLPHDFLIKPRADASSDALPPAFCKLGNRKESTSDREIVIELDNMASVRV
jgi:hypothetical protein